MCSPDLLIADDRERVVLLVVELVELLRALRRERHGEAARHHLQAPIVKLCHVTSKVNHQLMPFCSRAKRSATTFVRHRTGVSHS
jgi:hypothetical protein